MTLSALQDSNSIHPTLTGLPSNLRLRFMGFMNDISLSEEMFTVVKDVEILILEQRRHACPLTPPHVNSLPSTSIISQILTPKTSKECLGYDTTWSTNTQRSHGRSASHKKVDDLNRAINHLTLLHSHNAGFTLELISSAKASLHPANRHHAAATSFFHI